MVTGRPSAHKKCRSQQAAQNKKSVLDLQRHTNSFAPNVRIAIRDIDDGFIESRCIIEATTNRPASIVPFRRGRAAGNRITHLQQFGKALAGELDNTRVRVRELVTTMIALLSWRKGMTGKIALFL